MDLVGLLFAIFVGGLALNLWLPVFRWERLATLSFFLGLVTGLIPVHWMVVQAAIAGLLALLGGFDSALGEIALGILGVSWVAMLAFHLRSYGTRRTVEAALQEGLGSGYRDEVDPAIREQFATGLAVGRIANPFVQDLPGVEILKDLPYGEEPIQSLDIYRKATHGQKRPVLFQIHGGAWTKDMGSKNEQARPLMNHMALRDWVCVSAGYRLSPGVQLPAHIIDVKRALLWVKDHIAEYGGDPDFIVATGGSAGGHLSSLLALTPNDPLFQPTAPDRDTSVQGCVPYYGAIDLIDEGGLALNGGLGRYMADTVIGKPFAEAEDLWRALSPMHRVHAEAPPFFVICGDRDSLVSEAQNAAFAAQLRAKSRAGACYASIRGAQHAFDFIRTPHSEYVVHAIERWLGVVYTRHAASRAAVGS